MIASIFEILIGTIAELLVYVICYPTGAMVIRILTLWRVRYPLWGRKEILERQGEIDHLWLCVTTGLLFYLAFGIWLYSIFFK